MEFKEVLKELRKSKDLSQEKLAEVTGLSYSVIVKWECGYIEPTVRSLKTLAKFFDVTTDYLLGLEK